MVRIDEFRAVSNVLVAMSQAWQQYSAGANASAVIYVLRVVKLAPQDVPARRPIAQTQEFIFLVAFTRCYFYVRLLN